MLQVDLVYDGECPHVGAARANLMRAFSRAKVPARWKEHQIGSSEIPQRARGFGSPTVLVEGADVGGLVAGPEDCCRVYESGGAPSVEMIVSAFDRAGSRSKTGAEPRARRSRNRWKSTAAVLPGIGIALMPKVVCPLCWPAYAGVLGAAGLTFLMEDRWLLPISAIFLFAALAALAWRARSRRGYGPLGFGAIGALTILIGKFVLHSTVATYSGIAVLILACFWNAWPRRAADASCSACCSAIPK